MKSVRWVSRVLKKTWRDGSVAILFLSLIFPIKTFAFTWVDLWQRADQQGMHALQKGQPERAAHLFKDPQWQAVAWYRAKYYQTVIDLLTPFNTADSYFNRGNAHVYLKQYEQAIAAYEHALLLNPHHDDARFNRDLVKKLFLQAPANTNANMPSANHTKGSIKSSVALPKSMRLHSAAPAGTDAIDKSKAATINAPMAAPGLQHKLNQVTDDPGGLLKQKFLLEHQRRQLHNIGGVYDEVG